MLKEGMYVRCPVDSNAQGIGEARTFFLGQIAELNEEAGEALVVFHDPFKLRNFFISLPEKLNVPTRYLSRTTVLDNAVVIFKGRRVKLLCSAGTPTDRHYSYYIEYQKDGKANVGAVSETQIQVPFTKANYNPCLQMINYDLQNPAWYSSRRVVSKSLNMIANAPYGFQSILGTRVHLFAHQVDTIIRALSEKPCRLMLADEVGLGKTIEALSIFKGLRDKEPQLRAIAIVPESLLYQWDTELSYKFWMEAQIWGKDRIDDPQILLVSGRDFVRDSERITRICRWKLCMVDETHNLLRDQALYTAVLALCRDVENLLLLSATPILRREEEYGKLLTLLNPQRFEGMASQEFANLLERQKSIQDIVFELMRDLPDYLDYGLHSQFVEGLQEIENAIQDPRLTSLINGIDPEAPDMGLAQVKLVLAYIAEFYQIERGIIRHRRAELDGVDIRRTLVELTYEMSGSDVGFYEDNCYQAVMELGGEIASNQPNVQLIAEMLLSAQSSPYALVAFLDAHRVALESYDTENVSHLLTRWKRAYNHELGQIREVSDNIDEFHGKIARIVDYIDQEDYKNEKKFLLFTAFTETAVKLEECFIHFFGKGTTVSFHRGKSPEEVQEAASIFQTQPLCRFMICDESGGEGRNFQSADYIVHCDLPMSPAVLEQRIGRLDRIGRDPGKPVTSVVVYAQNTLEHALFEVYDMGLGIFAQSLCGMEIAFGEIQVAMEAALLGDMRSGLFEAVPEIAQFTEIMRNEIEKERYYDLARQLDRDLQERLDGLIAHFTDQDGEELMRTMMAWPEMAGFRGVHVSDAFRDGSPIVMIDTSELNQRSMYNSLYFPPRMDELIKRSKYKNDIRGTFSRSAAVKYESLTFFAPYNPLFDSITRNAEECYRGRCVAACYQQSSLDWKGLVLTWNIRYNPKKLYEQGVSPELISLVSRYLPGEQVIYTQGLTQHFDTVSTETVLDELDRYGHKRAIHLGKRDNGAIRDFMKRYQPEQWTSFVKKTYKRGANYAKERYAVISQAEKARQDLQKIVTATAARELFYGSKDVRALLTRDEEIDMLVDGLEHPVISLDSIALIYFERG